MRALSSSWACDTSPVDDSERLNVNRVLQLFTPNLFPAAVKCHPPSQVTVVFGPIPTPPNNLSFSLKKKRAQTLSQQRQRRDRGAIKRVFLCHRLATESRAIRRLEATALEGPLGSALLLSCEPLSLCDADLPPASVALNNSL